MFTLNFRYQAKPEQAFLCYINASEDTGEIVYAIPVHCNHAIALYANSVFCQWLKYVTCLKQAHCCHVCVHFFFVYVTIDVINIMATM